MRPHAATSPEKKEEETERKDKNRRGKEADISEPHR